MSTYSFNGMDLRVVEIDGEPWFVAVDLYKAVYGKTTGINAKDIMSPDEHQVLRKKGLSEADTLRSLFTGGQYRLGLISESGLYKVTMRSDKKEAKAFQDWGTREVLPSIRKTGSYTMPGARKTIEAPKGAEAENVPPPL